MLGVAQPVVDQTEEARRVALHQEFPARILSAERALAADVLVEPLVAHEGEVRADEPGVELSPLMPLQVAWW